MTGPRATGFASSGAFGRRFAFGPANEPAPELVEVVVPVTGPGGRAWIGLLAPADATRAELEVRLAREALALELADRAGATPPDGWGHGYLAEMVRTSPRFGAAARALLEAVGDPARREPVLERARRVARDALDRLARGEPGAGRVGPWRYGR